MRCKDSMPTNDEKSLTESETRFGSLSNLRQLWAGTFRVLNNEASNMMPLQSMCRSRQSLRALDNSQDCQKKASMKLFQGLEHAIQTLQKLYHNRLQQAFITCYMKRSTKAQELEDSEYFNDLHNSKANRAKVAKPKYSVTPYVQNFRMFAQIHDQKSETPKKMKEIKPDLLEEESVESENENEVDKYFSKPKPATKKIYNLSNKVYLTTDESRRLRRMEQQLKATRSVSSSKLVIPTILSMHKPAYCRTSSVPRALPNGYIYVRQ